MLDIDDLVDMTTWWFYIPIISVVLIGLTGMAIHSRIFQNKTNQTKNILYFIILIILFLVDLIIYIYSIRICPHKFISYLFSIYIPIPLLFVTIALVVISGIKSIKKFKYTIEAINNLAFQLFLIVSIKCSFALAYGSLSAIIWIFADYIVTLGKFMVISDKYDASYDKKID